MTKPNSITSSSLGDSSSDAEEAQHPCPPSLQLVPASSSSVSPPPPAAAVGVVGVSRYSNAHVGLRARPSPFKLANREQARPRHMTGATGEEEEQEEMADDDAAAAAAVARVTPQRPRVALDRDSEDHLQAANERMATKSAVIHMQQLHATSPLGASTAASSFTPARHRRHAAAGHAAGAISPIPSPSGTRLSAAAIAALSPPSFAFAGGSSFEATSSMALMTSTVPSSDVFSSFLQSSAYRDYEAELRTEGAVDLSRRSGGGVPNSAAAAAANVTAAAGAKARLRKQAAMLGLSGPAAATHAAGAAAVAAAASAAIEASFEPTFDDDREKGDYAIVIRLESKLIKSMRHAARIAAATEPPSSEISRGNSAPTLAVPPDEFTASTNRGPSAVAAADGMPAPCPTPSSRSRASISASAVAAAASASAASEPSTHRVDLLSDSALHGSHRLRTLVARLTRAGLKAVREPQIVDGCALLKVYAPPEVLEHAAWRLRLKMPLKPNMTPGEAQAKKNSRGRPIPMADEATDTPTSADPASEGAAGAAAAAAAVPTSYLPFDPSIRDQFVGTPDPTCLFRSSERHILIDFLLRTSRAQGGAGLGNQAANELEYRRKVDAKRKAREKVRKAKLKAQVDAANRSAGVMHAGVYKQQAALQAAINGDFDRRQAAAMHAAMAAAEQAVLEEAEEGESSSEDEDHRRGRDAGQEEDDNSPFASPAAAADEEEVPHIEQYILSRFPLHSSRLDALDSWISYWHLRHRLGGVAWFTGLFHQPLDAISVYFGNEVAFYFAFQNFYIRSLIIPSVLGLILFLTQLGVSNIDSPLLPVVSLFFAVWSSILLEVWKRRESSLSWRWGSFEYELEEEAPRPEFAGELVRDPMTGLEEKVYPMWKRVAKLTCSSTVWMWILGAFGYAMVWVFSKWDRYSPQVKQLDVGTGYFSLDLLFVPCLWGILIPLLDLLFNHVAVRLTEWENWKLGSTFRALLIAKVFSFRFVNAFLALYYYMFDARDDGLVRLTTSVASFMLAGQFLRFMLAVGGPYLSKRFYGWKAQRRAKQTTTSDAANGGAATSSSPQADSLPSASSDLSQAWLESTYPEYDHFEDYADMAIQFGYVCFFSSVFPFAPLCALVNNLVMVRVSAYKLCRLTKRPLACKASGLGVWLQVLQLMSVVAVLTNTAMIGVTSLQLSAWFPDLSTSTKILAIFAFEHVVLLMKIAIAFAIPDVTAEVEQQRRKEKFQLNRANTEMMELRRKQILDQLSASGDLGADALYAVTL